MNMHGLSSSASLAKPNAYKYNGGTELTAEFGWEMYDTPNRSYDAQLGRFHQIDPLADSQSSFTPYHFGYNDPIYWSDPTGLCPSCPRSMSDIYDELMARSFEGSTMYNFDNGNLIRNHAGENDFENWIEDFTNNDVTAEYFQDGGGGGFWMDYGRLTGWKFDFYKEGRVIKQQADLENERSRFIRYRDIPYNRGLSGAASGDFYSKQLDMIGIYSSTAGFVGTMKHSNYGWIGENGTRYKSRYFGRVGSSSGLKSSAARIAKPLKAFGNLGALGYFEAGNQFIDGNYTQGAMESFFTTAGFSGNPYGAAASFGWEIGRGITMIPAYQRFKKNTWMPWRKKNLGY